MSGAGAPTPHTPVDGSGLRVVIIAATWHQTISEGLIAGAQRTLEAAGAEHSLVRVPGSFELALGAQAAFAGGADAVVALGVIIRGGTPHFDYVCQSLTHGLTETALRTAVPVGNGVLTCDTLEQALDRAGLPGSSEDKGWEAVVAALDTALVLRGLRARGAQPV